jgi:hypothetical protein
LYDCVDGANQESAIRDWKVWHLDCELWIVKIKSSFSNVGDVHLKKKASPFAIRRFFESLLGDCARLVVYDDPV